MKSIRQRLTRSLTAGVMLVVSLGGLALYPAVKRALLAEFDYALLAKAHALTSFSDPLRRGVNLQFTEAALPEFQPGTSAEYFQVTLADGTILARSPSLGHQFLTVPAASDSLPDFQNIALPDGRRGRAVFLTFADAGASSIVVTLAKSRERLDRTFAGLLAGIAVGGLLLLVMMQWLVRRTVRAGLAPVNELATKVTGINSSSLEKRLDPACVPRELCPVVEELNCLLQRIESAFERERRITSDVAHELATPIAELRSLTDVALRWRDAETEGAVAEKANAIARQMERTVRMLLALARAEAGRQVLQRTKVEVASVVQELTGSIEARLAARNIHCHAIVPPGLSVWADETILRSIILNLLDNAADYTPSGGDIEICAGQRNGAVTLAVSNTQDILEPEDLLHVFEPMWRKDNARADASHCGLGLALVRTYAEGLAIDVRAELPEKRRFCVTLSIPVLPETNRLADRYL